MADLLHNAVKCSVCQHLFFTVMIDAKDQAEDLIAKLGRHLELRHKEELSRNANATKELAALVIAHVFLNNMTVIPTENVALSNYAAELQDQLLQMLGFDETEDEEDTEENDNSEEILSMIERIKDTTTDPTTAESLGAFIELYLKPPEEIPLNS